VLVLSSQGAHTFGYPQPNPNTMRFACITALLAASLASVDAFGVVTKPMPSLSHGRSLASSTTQLQMAEGTTITMPALSSTMKEGRVVSWLKNEGDEISAGEAIMVVESDKADVSTSTVLAL